MVKKLTTLILIALLSMTMLNCSLILAIGELFSKDYEDYEDYETENDDDYQEYENWRIKYNALKAKVDACCGTDSNDFYASDVPQTSRNRLSLTVKGVTSSSVNTIKKVVANHATFDESLVNLLDNDLIFEKIYVKTTKGSLLDAIEALSSPTFIFKEINGVLYDLSASATVTVKASGRTTPGVEVRIKGKSIITDENGYWETEISVDQGETSVPYDVYDDGEYINSGTVQINPGSPITAQLITKESVESTYYNENTNTEIDYAAKTEEIKQKYYELEDQYNACCTGSGASSSTDVGSSKRKKVKITLSGVTSGSKQKVLDAVSANSSEYGDVSLSGSELTIVDVMVDTTKGALLDEIESIGDPTFIFKELVANYYDMNASATVTVKASGRTTPGVEVVIKGQSIITDENGYWEAYIDVDEGETEVQYDVYDDGEYINSGTVPLN